MGARAGAAHLLSVTSCCAGQARHARNRTKIVKNVPGWSCHVPRGHGCVGLREGRGDRSIAAVSAPRRLYWPCHSARPTRSSGTCRGTQLNCISRIPSHPLARMCPRYAGTQVRSQGRSQGRRLRGRSRGRLDQLTLSAPSGSGSCPTACPVSRPCPCPRGPPATPR